MDVVVPGGLARDIGEEGRDALDAALALIRPPRMPIMEPRLARLREDAEFVRGALASLPVGPVASVLPRTEGEGLGRGDGARGTAWHWLDVREGRVAQAFAADPAMLLWPEMERAAPGLRLSELPVRAAAIGLATAGVDL
jgi:Ni,Fe-hydrogenase III large subunit